MTGSPSIYLLRRAEAGLAAHERHLRAFEAEVVQTNRSTGQSRTVRVTLTPAESEFQLAPIRAHVAALRGELETP